MKKFLPLACKAVLILILFLFFFSACNREESSAYTLDKDTSYAFGMFMASFMTSQMGFPEVSLDYDAFRDGFKAYNEAQETRISMDQAMEKIIEALTLIEAQQNEEMWLQGEKNREEGEAFLAENRRRSGVITTSSGLQYEIITQGSGERPGPTDMVKVHYEGSFINGEIFDSSYVYGAPADFSLDWLIPGFSEGIQLMNEGSTYRLFIPSNLAYGPGNQMIPPYSTLIFRVELLEVMRY